MNGSRTRSDAPTGVLAPRHSAVASLLWPRRPAPGPRAEVERGLATIFLLLRLGVFVQIVLGSISGVRATGWPAAYLMLAAGILANILASGWATWNAESVLPGLWRWVDLAVAVVAVLGCSVLLPPHLIVGTWQSWAYGYATISTAAAGTWCRPVRTAFLLITGIGVLYVATTWARSDSDDITIIDNALTYPAFGAIAIVFSTYWRRIAADSEAATRLAIDAAERAQTDRYRLMVHDIASILRMLGDESTPAVQLPALRRQAMEESHRLRAYLSDAPAPFGAGGTGAPPHTLGGVITESVAGFTDLPIDLLIDLGAPAPLSPNAVPALSAAISTLLHNVRVHAHATDVVVHADVVAGTWELVLTDNGIGFDPSTTPFGFGLREQVLRALSRQGITAEITSAPRQGCTVTITGPVSPDGARP